MLKTIFFNKLLSLDCLNNCYFSWDGEIWRDEYLKWICGFANAQGGKIYIGTNDDGTVIGIQDSKKLMEDIPNKVRDILGIIIDVNLLSEDGKEYIEICVSSNAYPVNYRGEYHYRSGSTKQLLKGQVLNQFLLKKTGITWDSVPIQDVAVRDLRNVDAAHKGLVTGKDRDDYIETARRKAHDLKEYIDVLFDWFKLNSDEFALEIQPVEAAELTRNILIDWIPIFEDKQVDYDIDIPEQPVWVRLDMDSYMRIINNLIQNVIAHSHADKIKIVLSKKENNMELLLADNGVGIEKEDLKHIFERLYKCDKGRSEKGSGLGLSIVHQLVEKMGGSITVESFPGKGTAFMLLFPLEI